MDEREKPAPRVGAVFAGVKDPDLWVLSLIDSGYLEVDKPASDVLGIESPLYRGGVRKEPFDKEASNTLLPEAVGGGVRRPVLLKSQITHDIGLIERLLLVLPSLVEVGAVSDVKCHAKDLDPLELAKSVG